MINKPLLLRAVILGSLLQSLVNNKANKGSTLLKGCWVQRSGGLKDSVGWGLRFALLLKFGVRVFGGRSRQVYSSGLLDFRT